MAISDLNPNESLGRAEDDRTILVPNPGGRRAAAPPWPLDDQPAREGAQWPAPSAPRPAGASASVQLHGRGLNPLVHAANPLLNLIAPLRATTAWAGLDELREQLVYAIRNFENDLRARRIDPDLIAASRYVLCTFLDETIAGTPWGGGGAWAGKSLLVAFHNEAWGGEKVFVILQRLSQNPAANLHALELIYLCLALGMEGRYRVRENGREQLETLRERLRQMIQTQRGAYERDLSLRWRGAVAARKSLLEAIPVWVLVAISGAALAIAHLGLSYVLSSASDPVYTAMSRVHVSAPAPEPQAVATTPARAAPPEPAPPRLAVFLAPDIERGLVGVAETADRATVTLYGDGFFASGSADLRPGHEALIGRIADALNALPGKVMVIGHTDDLRSFSARFPSNWELSKARAASVIRLLAARAGPPDRYSGVGRGETEPLVPNNSAANRARNRRVDIVLLAPTAMNAQEKR
jgi:type VI secretion system protein ImpK